MAEIIDAGVGFTTAGESRAIETLRDLPADWLVVANKVLPIRPGESYEADLIVVGPHRIWLIDEKSYRGSIIGSDQTWTLHGGQSVQSPLNKVDFVAKKLAGWLRDRVTRFPTGRPAGDSLLAARDTYCRAPAVRGVQGATPAT